MHASRLLGLFFFHSLLEISEKGFHHILCLKRFTGSVSDGSSKATSNLDEFGIALILTTLVTFNDTRSLVYIRSIRRDTFCPRI